MNFTYTPELVEYMKKKNNTTILVELVELNNTDLEIMELTVRLPDARTRDVFINKKQYRVIQTEVGEVLLPNFPLVYSDTVAFGLKKFLCFYQISYQGIATPKVF